MSSAPSAPRDDGRHGPRPLTAIMVVALAIIGVVVGSTFLPRWWSHRIAEQANGSFTSGIGLGLFCGFIFTLLALLALWSGVRRITSWKARLILVGIALLIALPNLLTLAIVLGVGSGAYAGERTLDLGAPGFRVSSLVGAVAGVLAVLAVGLLLRSRRRSKEDAAALRKELAEARRPPVEP